MRKLFFFFLLSVSLFSCVGGLGFGVVIWKEEGGGLDVGDVVRVHAKSEASGFYVVSVEGMEEKREVPMRSLILASDMMEVEELKERLRPLRPLFAESLIDALPIRVDADNLSRQIYKLRAGQIMKLLWEVEGAPPMVGGKRLEGKWFRVMTDDGVEGYCFSYNLAISDSPKGRVEEANKARVGIMAGEDDPISKDEEDEGLEKVLSSTWYPEYYRKMLNSKNVDLDLISSSYGFFPGADTKTARVILPHIQRTFQYSNIKKVRGKYRFGDSPLSLYIRNVDIITVEFTDEEGSRLYENFVTLNAPIEKIIENEKMRREEEVQHLVGYYESQNYGEMEITKDGYFLWQGYNAIVPFIIPNMSDSAGTVFFKYFISRALKKETGYSGVLSFKFSSMEDSIDFMYKMKDDSLIMEPVSKDLMEDGVVIKRGDAITLVFFKAEKKVKKESEMASDSGVEEEFDIEFEKDDEMEEYVEDESLE